MWKVRINNQWVNVLDVVDDGSGLNLYTIGSGEIVPADQIQELEIAA
jgi:hypothetical protein